MQHDEAAANDESKSPRKQREFEGSLGHYGISSVSSLRPAITGIGVFCAGSRKKIRKITRTTAAPIAGVSQMERQLCVMTPEASVSVYMAKTRPASMVPTNAPTPQRIKAIKPWQAPRIRSLA